MSYYHHCCWPLIPSNNAVSKKERMAAAAFNHNLFYILYHINLPISPSSGKVPPHPIPPHPTPSHPRRQTKRYNSRSWRCFGSQLVSRVALETFLRLHIFAYLSFFHWNIWKFWNNIFFFTIKIWTGDSGTDYVGISFKSTYFYINKAVSDTNL